MPGLVELAGEDLVLVEVAGLDRQVGRLEGPAALLVDHVEGPDQPYVVAEIGDVACPAAAIQVADERRPADGAEHDVGAAEDHVSVRVPGVQPELTWRERHELLDLGRLHPHGPRTAVDHSTSTDKRVKRPVAEHLHPDL